MVSNLTRVKNWYQILTNVKNRYQIITDVMNWYLIVTDVRNKTTVKHWNRMQKAADLGRVGVFYQCEEYACVYVLCGIGTKSSQCEIYEV